MKKRSCSIGWALLLMLAWTIPSLAGDSTQTVAAQPEASACSRVKCIRECQHAGGTLDDCRAACRGASSTVKKRVDPFCVQKCMGDGYSRETCEERCTTHEPAETAPPELPAPSKPRPGN